MEIESPRRMDILQDAEKLSGGANRHPCKASWRRTLIFAFQCIGVVYGDIGTSPLYVYSSTFTGGIKNDEDVLGVLSLIIYTLLLLPIVKYVFIVLYADDSGDGKLNVDNLLSKLTPRRSWERFTYALGVGFTRMAG